jgi:protein translocase subunit secA 2
MSDLSLIRSYAGNRLRLADSIRQVQADILPNKAELFLHQLAGLFAAKKIRRREIGRLNSHVLKEAEGLRHFTSDEWPALLLQAIDDLKQQPHHFPALARVLACVGVATEYILGYFPHPVQFFGIYVLLSGSLAQMQTGEGKTLVAALTAIIVAASGAYVHVLSTNDYLAERDETEMRSLFVFFGLTSAAISSDTAPELRREAYRQNICYVSAKEIVFDYLKDKLPESGVEHTRLHYIRQLQKNMVRQEIVEPIIPALHFCIVDEADSILIDEARTPLVISRETNSLVEPELLQWAIRVAGSLKEGVHFTINHVRRDVMLNISILQYSLPLPAEVRPVWKNVSWQRLIIRQALSALYLYREDEHYIIRDGKIQIVDESTGRLMLDRSWEQGLHQLIEIKEGLSLSQERETLAKMTFQRFFRQYLLLSGLTGTATEVARELWAVYDLRVRDIPPNKPNRRTYFPIRCFGSLQQKWEAIAQDALSKAAKGQPVLIGTRSVEASDCVARQLEWHVKNGAEIDFVVLNARQDCQEAEIVAQAGRSGRITVATNMAGRGTDIKLEHASKQAGGLHVILTEHHESARIDRQLIGRCGRQGDVGTVQVIVSFEEELLRHHQPLLCSIGKHIRFKQLAALWLGITVKLAQHAAQRHHYRVRMQTLKQDRELSKQIGFTGKVH